MIKALHQLGVEGTYLSTITATYDIPIAKVRLNGEKQKEYSL
jgi:hypothetical protein